MISYKWKIPETKLFDSQKSKIFINQETVRSLGIMTETVRTNVAFSAPAGATGQLRSTIGTSVSKSQGRVFTGVKYAPVIEKGRKAAPVSYKRFLRWIRLSTKGQKYFAALNSAGRLTARTQAGRVKQAAFMLAKSMAKKKRKANPFFARGVKRSEKRLRLEVGILGRRIANGLVKR